MTTDLHDLLAHLDDAGCNWAPDEDTPSIAATIVRLVDPRASGPIVRSRRELLALVRTIDPPPPEAVAADLARTARAYRAARERATATPSAARP